MKTIPGLFIPAFILTFLAFAGCEGGDGLYSDHAYYSENEYGYNEKYEDYGENPFVNTADQPVSTFSVDADGGSYANMRRFLYLGQAVPEASVRIEEYINYFTFDYPEPEDGENVSLNSELSACPWNEAHCLLRVGMKGRTIPDDELPDANYVFLIDVSGSMDSPNKLGILKTGFRAMAEHLRDRDRIAIVTYASHAGVLLPSTYGDRKDEIMKAIDKLGAGGSTAGAAGISTAYEIAMENYLEDGNNRVILGTDGDFNVGPSSTDALVELIEEKRESGIYLTVLGVGGGNLNDRMMEQIANKGNGNYEYIDNARQIEKVFVKEKAKFYTVAKDAKIRITFNEARVDSYRLIGYENRALNQEDFEQDTVDAGEIGSSQTITVLYELIMSDNEGRKPFAQFDFRYKKPGEPASRLLTHSIRMVKADIGSASKDMRFAAAVSGFGLIMKGSAYKGNADKQMVLTLGESALGYDVNGYKNEFVDLVRNWQE